MTSSVVSGPVGTVTGMTDDTTAQSAPDHDTEASDSSRPRVPNVRPGAVSGLDNVLLNAAADAAAERANQPDDGTSPDIADSDQNSPGAVETEHQSVEGETVQSETAGTGEKVNAETGQVTAPGEQLPPIEGDQSAEGSTATQSGDSQAQGSQGGNA